MDRIFVEKTYFCTDVWRQLSPHADRCLPNLVMVPVAGLREKTLYGSREDNPSLCGRKVPIGESP
jgi:hypothetical protein